MKITDDFPALKMEAIVCQPVPQTESSLLVERR